MAAADVITPVPLLVPLPPEAVASREPKADALPVIYRHYPGTKAEVEASFTAAWSNTQARFLAALAVAAKRSLLDEATVAHPTFDRFLAWFQAQPRVLPVTRELARLWALGQSDEPVRVPFLEQLRLTMAGHIRSEAVPAGGLPAGQAVRLVPVASPREAPGLAEVDDRGVAIDGGRLVTLAAARQDFLASFPEEQQAMAAPIAGLLKENCRFDPSLNAAYREQTLARVRADRYEAGDLVVQAGQIVDARAQAALAALAERRQAEQERLARRQRWADAGLHALDTLDRWVALGVAATRRVSPERPWLVPALAAAVASLLLLRLKRREKPSLLPARLVNEEIAYTAILNPARNETIFLPFRRTVEPTMTVTRLVDLPSAAVAPAPDQQWQERILAAEQRAEQLLELVRDGLAPHLAKQMTGELVRELIAQREQVHRAQRLAEQQLSEVEDRFAQLHARLMERLAVHEHRTAELEKELAAKEEQNRRLMQTAVAMTQKLAGETAKPPPPPAPA